MDRTVLAVDDHDDTRQLLRRELSRRGYHALVAHDHVSAAYAARRRKVDFAIVDQNLTGKIGDRSGLELAADLVAIHPMMRIVMITGYPSSDAAFHAGRRPGIVGYLQKPASIEHIVEVLEGRPRESNSAQPTLDEIARDYARRTLCDCGGNATRAAETLHITRSTLRRLIGA